MSENKFQPFICGPKEQYDIPKESLGKYFFDVLQKRNPKDIINIDPLTNETLTCGNLLEKSVKLVQVFKNFAVTQNDVISIVCPNSINYPIPILSALYMGAIANFLNPTYSKEEFKHAFLIARPKLIVCSNSVVDIIVKLAQELTFIQAILLLEPSPTDDLEISHIDQLIENVNIQVDRYKPTELDPTEGAFIMLSSGTTGLPKGVLLTHESFRPMLGFTCDPNYLQCSSGKVVLIPIPTYHVFGLIVLLAAISAKYQNIIMSKFKPEVFFNSIQKYQVQHLYVVPPLLLFMVNSSLSNNYDLSSVKDITVGAAAVGPELHEKANQKFPNMDIRQLYGITEVSGAVAFQNFKNTKPGSVGTLSPGLTVKIEDIETKKPLGSFKKGEICIKGSLVMKKYVRNEESTKNSLDQDNFYHTGDIGFYDDDNCLFIVGRLKELIKYKGFQVSPAELENLLMSHPDILDSGVIGIPDERAGELPMAFVVKKNGCTITEKDVVDFVAENISASKRLYGGVTFTDQIPKSTAGKILRKKLVEMYKNKV